MARLLTPERAAKLKAEGITHVASIVKSHYSSEYYKYESLDDILSNGGRMPAYAKYDGYVHGVRKGSIDWAHTVRWSAI